MSRIPQALGPRTLARAQLRQNHQYLVWLLAEGGGRGSNETGRSSDEYGMMPPGLFSTIRERFLSIINARNAHRVGRTRTPGSRPGRPEARGAGPRLHVSPSIGAIGAEMAKKATGTTKTAKPRKLRA
jgi:hypothetical protein